MKPYFETELCRCGCGGYVKALNKYINGHNAIGINRSQMHKAKIGEAQRRSWASSLRKRINPVAIGKICKACGLVFFIKAAQRKTRFCSYLCYRKHCSIERVGEKNTMYGVCGKMAPNWNGGLSFEPYPCEFNVNYKDQIRRRDNNICQVCDKTEDKNGKKLDIHHIDYNKDNIGPSNLVSLCKSCHMKTNFHRGFWPPFFGKLRNAA